MALSASISVSPTGTSINAPFFVSVQVTSSTGVTVTSVQPVVYLSTSSGDIGMAQSVAIGTVPLAPVNVTTLTAGGNTGSYPFSFTPFVPMTGALGGGQGSNPRHYKPGVLVGTSDGVLTALNYAGYVTASALNLGQ